MKADVEMLCTCGHYDFDHHTWADTSCAVMINERMSEWCDCIKFNLDALQYLHDVEQLYHTGE